MHDLSWWSHGATFKTPMRVLDLGGYDAILVMDWLKLHSPMTTDWQKKFISFPYQGHHVTLHGVPRAIATSVHELLVEQFAKWSKGNDIWAWPLSSQCLNWHQIHLFYLTQLPLLFSCLNSTMYSLNLKNSHLKDSMIMPFP
jgi:hypothetical protein